MPTEDRPSGRARLRLAQGNAIGAAGPAFASPISDTIDTNLIQVRRHSFDIKEFISRAEDTSGAAMAILGDRLMIAFRSGEFFQMRLTGDTALVSRLPLELALNEKEFLSEAAGKGDLSNAYMRVLDLAIIDDGSKVAASFTKWDPEKKCTSVYLAVRELSADWTHVDSKGWDIVFQSRPCMVLRLGEGKVFAGHQSGGRIVELRSGVLLLTIGDFEHDGAHENASNYPQDPNVDYGKIVEIDLHDRTTAVVSMGHRNAQGLFRDMSGRVWETEHGPRGGDELNLIIQGKDYGWPSVTLGTNYGSHTWPLTNNQGNHGRYEWPTYAWVPSLGISNLIAVRNFTPEWNGDLLVGSLGTQELRRLRLHTDRVVYDEAIAIGARIRDIDQLSDGRIVLLTDGGKLMVLQKSPDPDGRARSLMGSLSATTRSLIQSCMECHTINGATDTVAGTTKINLWGIFNRAIGAGGDPRLYSPAMKNTSGQWDQQTIDRFLFSPAEMIPGTSMQFPGVKEEGQRKQLMEFLKALN
jgi:cytochrome c2